MSPLEVLLASAEVVPFAKTGGLADVSAALPRYLASAGHDVRIVMPFYRCVREAFETTPVAALGAVPVELGSREIEIAFRVARLPDSEVDVYFVEAEGLFDRAQLYGDDDREHLRFALLSRAALTLCQWLQWSPDIVHCNDWHTALIPLYLRTLYAWDELFARTSTILTIHNIAYQGVFAAERLADIALPDMRQLFHRGDSDHGIVNYLKTGLLYADHLTTVSQTYAREIRSDEFGMGLESILEARKSVLSGIVNGIDYDEWNPETDPMIPFRFSAADLSGKRKCRAALLDDFGLEGEPAGPVFGIVSRLTPQKGFELLPDVLPVLMHRHDVRLCVLGSGDERHERYFEWLTESFPGRAGFHRGYSDELAHRIEAGADVFVMPSRFEPCGLNQMYSQRYGTAPLVRRTGGLADTVTPFDPRRGEGTGFVFDDFTAEALWGAFGEVLGVWQDRAAWSKLTSNAMRADWSWEHQGKLYEALYAQLAT